MNRSLTVATNIWLVITRPQSFLQDLESQNISFDERVELMINQEMTSRANKRLERRLKSACFRTLATVADINYTHPRGLKKSQMAALITVEWIAKNQNLLITGPTGCGKTYLSCALGNHA
ncbi:MAG: ATP-binding protein [Pseudomonadales bacterium]|nr:ATP-binding protein [Pseudomonadales bacterium]